MTTAARRRASCAQDRRRYVCALPSSVCGDCCEITEGGATTLRWPDVLKRGGKSLAGGWLGLVGWLAVIISG